MANTIIRSFEETVEKYGDRPAARYRDAKDEWASITWSEMSDKRRFLAAGLIDLGLAPKERVNILANTSIDWMIADLGIQSAGGETVPIYQSNLAHEVEYIVNNCGAVMVIAENTEQLAKLKAEKDKLGNVRKVIVLDDSGGDDDWTINYSDLLQTGAEKLESSKATIDERIAAIKPEDIVTIIYTSGTTGPPKGVVLTHSNMTYIIGATVEVGLIKLEYLELLFLPMAHVFAKLLQCTWLGTGHEMAIDSDITRITANLKEVRPHMVASVPRIFEKVYAKVVGSGLEAPGMKGKLFKWAVELNDQYAEKMIKGEPVPFGLDLKLALAKRLVFSKIEEKLTETFGGRLEFFISGGAPLPKKMAFFFANAGVTILEGYGLTETSAATTVNRIGMNKIGTVGKPMPGTEVKIADDGEILIRGPGVMREYWQREDATQEVMTPDGWFMTGDIGVIDSDGFLKITDRKKDIIVTAGGKNVAPQNIEALVKSANPLISQVMVYGDKRKYLSALVTLEPEAAGKLGKEAGVTGSYEDITKSDAARGAVQETIDKVNGSLARYETIKKFEILDKDFEVGKELTPTLKVKRKFCTEQYKGILDGFYDEAVVE